MIRPESLPPRLFMALVASIFSLALVPFIGYQAFIPVSPYLVWMITEAYCERERTKAEIEAKNRKDISDRVLSDLVSNISKQHKEL